MLKYILAGAALLFLTAMTFAQTPVTPTPEEQTQRVITSQLEAFLEDDSETAFELTDQNTHDYFKTAEAFLKYVSEKLPMLHRPGNFAFGKVLVNERGTAVVQEVLITGPKGLGWRILFGLAKQDDGQFKITGVRVGQLLSDTSA